MNNSSFVTIIGNNSVGLKFYWLFFYPQCNSLQIPSVMTCLNHMLKVSPVVFSLFFISLNQSYWGDTCKWNYIAFKCTFVWHFICILHCVFTTQSQISFHHHIFDHLYFLYQDSDSVKETCWGCALSSLSFCHPYYEILSVTFSIAANGNSNSQV